MITLVIESWKCGLDCLEATVFSPENMSLSVSELQSDILRNTDAPPVETFHVSSLDSSGDECVDETAP